MAVSGSFSASGSFRELNFDSKSGWGIFRLCGVCCSNTHAYAIASNTTNNTNLPGLDIHLIEIPLASFSVANAVRLASFTYVTGSSADSSGPSLLLKNGVIYIVGSRGLWSYTIATGTLTYIAEIANLGGQSSGLVSDSANANILYHSRYNPGPAGYDLVNGDLAQLRWRDMRAGAHGLVGSIQEMGNGRYVVLCDRLSTNTITGDSTKGTSIGVFDIVKGTLTMLCGDRGTQADGATFSDKTLAWSNAGRASVQGVVDIACSVDTGELFAICNVNIAYAIRKINADQTAVSTFATAGDYLPQTSSKIGASPDGNYLVYSRAEELIRVS